MSNEPEYTDLITGKPLEPWAVEAMKRRSSAAFTEPAAAMPAPIDMLLYCPICGIQHVDEPDERTPDWSNPPHRSHLCHGCGCIWRPADVPTNGVARITTVGKADTWGESNSAAPTRPAAAMPGVPSRGERGAAMLELRSYAGDLPKGSTRRRRLEEIAELFASLAPSHSGETGEVERLREALPDIETEGERLVAETPRRADGSYLWTDVVGAVQTALADERGRHAR